MSKIGSRIFWVSIYSIAMAYLEAAVVVYLRRVYGIGDLILQIPPFDPQIAAIELGREVATLVMLISIGWIAGIRLQSQIGFAIFSFGLWDIFYYVWLRIMIGWPHNVLDPDLLFLLPLPWWGPVLSPVLIAALMAAGGLIATIKDVKGEKIHLKPVFWVCMVIGLVMMLYTFMADALNALPADSAMLSDLRPSQFNWPVYLVGLGLAAFSLWQMASDRSSSKTII